MADPQSEQPSFALMTNDDNSVFVKVARSQGGKYNFSRVFAAMTSDQELCEILQILRRIGQVVGKS
ncbi:hypothetical protein D0962_34635 [Leptolyngbyaceae cyanobacterium CCMR0082]|uniref:Uncharacterized protein n=1 Tax=Adonisia turfae CCMR0082 TaxID=2304604 RepID=A0A6M0SHM4_9CYAN|nr:hypothetical protein [Adonisia turfae]NEZ67836.1 hypothetical protein [Adonisia turfae CCMR0082]